MNATKPEVLPTGRYSIKDTAKHLGLSTRTVYRYINDKVIAVQYRKANSKPFITGIEIIRVWNSTY